MKVGPELDAVALMVMVVTTQVRVAAGSAKVVGIFTSAVTLTEAVAVQPLVVLVTRRV